MVSGDGVGHMSFQCRACEARFHDCDQNQSQQRAGQCPICGYDDIQEIKPEACPVLSMGHATPQFCIQQSCLSWNDFYQMCNMAIPGFLNARYRSVLGYRM